MPFIVGAARSAPFVPSCPLCLAAAAAIESPASSPAPPPPPPVPHGSSSRRKGPVLICPAQFGTADDYEELVDGLKALGHHPVVVAPLRFTDWLRLIPAAGTREYWEGRLDPNVALPFYYEAIERGSRMIHELLEEERVVMEGNDASASHAKVNIVAHSIGGWIARAYLAQMDTSARASTVGALVTLGTPHVPPPTGIFQAMDQTRGLLSFVDRTAPGAFHRAEGLRYLTVGSRVVKGKIGGGGSEGLSLASLLAAAR